MDFLGKMNLKEPSLVYLGIQNRFVFICMGYA